VEGSCEHGNEPSGSIRCCKFLGYLNDWQLLKKDSEELNIQLLLNGVLDRTARKWSRPI
jgi:hypothetical protein